MTFQELLDDERALGRAEGQIIGTIQTARKYHATDDEILMQLMSDFDISEEKAKEYIKNN